MARDIFIQFKKDRKPTKVEVQHLLEDYFKDIATDVRWDGDRFFVSLPGTPTNALGRIKGAHTLGRIKGEPDRTRWIEVVRNNATLWDVLTRGMDEVTNAMAEGVVEILARFWKGEVDSG